MNGDYIIKGDTKDLKECLVCVVGRSYTDAEYVLNRMLNNPTENDKRLIKGFISLGIDFVEERDCWWRGNCD